MLLLSLCLWFKGDLDRNPPVLGNDWEGRTFWAQDMSEPPKY